MMPREAASRVVSLPCGRPRSASLFQPPRCCSGQRRPCARKTPRRRQIDPTTCERDYTDCEVEFMNALDDYKRKSGRMFPTCSEVLEVVRSLGYVKVGTAQPISCSAEPFVAAPDSQAITPPASESNAI